MTNENRRVKSSISRTTNTNCFYLYRSSEPRVTIDFHGLSAVTYKDKFSLPYIQDCLHTLDRAVFMSVIDLSNSFYQVPIQYITMIEIKPPLEPGEVDFV